MFRYFLLELAHFVAVGIALKIFSIIGPTCAVISYNNLANILLWIIIALCTLPVVKKYLVEYVSPDNKAVFITGCDSGFGHHVAKNLDRLGYHVFAGCLFPKGDGATELKLNSSNRLHVLGLDVTKDQSVKDALVYLKENLGSSELWAVINNAGISKGFGVEFSKLDDFRDTFEVNVYGIIRVAKTFFPLLKQTKGRLINITSMAGRFPLPYATPYTVSKHAAVGFNDCLRIEAEPWGIKVISIEPEMFKTNMTSISNLEKLLEKCYENVDSEILADFGERYLKGFKQQMEIFANLSSPNIHAVVDSILKAVRSKNPEIRYKPCRNIAIDILRFFVELLPTRVTDFIIFSFIKISGMPIPKEADNSL